MNDKTADYLINVGLTTIGLCMAIFGSSFLGESISSATSRISEISAIKNNPIVVQSKQYKKIFDKAEDRYFNVAGNSRFKRENPERIAFLERKVDETRENWRRYNRENRKSLVNVNEDINEIKNEHPIYQIVGNLGIGAIFGISGLALAGAGASVMLGRKEHEYVAINPESQNR